MPHKALFLDRDGVINQEIGYLHRPEDVRWVPGFHSMARTAQALGWKLVVVTNQAGIARGLYTAAQYQALMDWMRAELRHGGVLLDGIYHSPYHPEYGPGELRREHPDRKPGPGMLLRASRDLDLDLGASILVGDRCSDIGAGNAAGLRESFLLAGTERVGCPGRYRSIATLGELEAMLRTELAG